MPIWIQKFSMIEKGDAMNETILSEKRVEPLLLLKPTPVERLKRSYRAITKSRGGVVGAWLVGMMVFCALFAPYIAPL